jgi:uncharacterized protein YkwD
MNTEPSLKKSTTSTFLSRFGQTAIAGLVVGGMLSVSASPIYAWWFDSAKPTKSITPTHQRGLQLSPLIHTIIPKFVLEPLAKTEIEVPPTVDKAEAPVASPTPNRIVLTPQQSKPTPTSQSVTAQSKTAASTAFAQQMVDAVNAERAKHGLSPLTLNAQLSKSAQDYSVRMQQQDFFSHVSPDGGTFRDRNEAAGYTNWQWMGENIAYGQASVSEVMKDWMNSAGHRANILEPRAKELGVGFANGSRPYWVQEFGAQF